MMVYAFNTRISLVTKDDSLRSDTVDRLKGLMDTVPKYLDFRTRLDRASSEIVEIKERGNSYRPYVAQSSLAGADKVGRGASTPSIHFDEPPFQKYLHIHYQVIVGSTGARIDEAKMANAPWGFIMTTTAWKKNTEEGKFFTALVEGAAVWNEAYYDCEDIDDLNYTLYKASRDGVSGSLTKGDVGSVATYACFNHRQLGYTDEWLREVISRNKNPDPEAINRDFFNICTSGSESHPLSQDVLDRIIESKTTQNKHIEIDPKYRYTLNWYIPRGEVDSYINSRDVVVGVDCSEGIGKDYTTIVFLDAHTGEVLATSLIKESNSLTFAAWFHQLMVRFPNTVFIIENKSMGVYLIEALLVSLPAVGIDPYKRMYSRIVDDGNETNASRKLFDDIKVPLNRRDRQYFTGSFKKVFGYNTAGSGRHSRDNLYLDTLVRGMTIIADGIKDEALIEQIAGLTYRNGRVDHQEGGNDDLVISLLLCLWFILNAKNISYYGMDSRYFLTAAFNSSRDENQNHAIDTDQIELRHRFDYLLNQLENESNPVAIMQLEQQLEVLESRIRTTEQDATTAAEWISKAEEIKRRKRYQKSRNMSSSSSSARTSYVEGEFSSMSQEYYKKPTLSW